MPMVVVEKIDFHLVNMDKTNLDNMDKINLVDFDKTNVALDTKQNETITPKLQDPVLIKEEAQIANTIVNSETKDPEPLELEIKEPEPETPVEKTKSKHRKKHKSHSHSAGSDEIKHKNNAETESAKSKQKQEKDKGKRKVKHHDIRKAPQLDINLGIKLEELQPDNPVPVANSPVATEQIKSELPNEHNKLAEEIKNDHFQRVAIKIKLCNICNTRHMQDGCPLNNPLYTVQDAMTLDEWSTNYNNLKISSTSNIDRNDSIDKSDDSTSQEKSDSYAEQSVPSTLYLEQSETSHGLAIFAKHEIKEYTQFGPLVGNVVKEVDIAEDSNMRHIWEVLRIFLFCFYADVMYS